MNQMPQGVFLLPQLVAGVEGGLIGGYVNSVVNALEHLQERADVTLVAGVNTPGAWSEAGLDRRLPDVAFVGLQMRSTPTTPLYFGEFAVRATAALAARRRDSVYIFGHSGHPAYAAVTAGLARAIGARSIHALYCPIADEFQHRRVGSAERALGSYGLRATASIVAISKNVARTLPTTMQRDAAIIPPALAGSLFERPAANADPGRPRTLGFVGHHLPEKGLDIALGAFALMLNEDARLRLRIVASGAESRERPGEVLKLVRESGIHAHVDVEFGIRDMRDFYRDVGVVLVPFRDTRGPSDYPMVLLEALACGLPTVVTPVGAVTEVIDDGLNGFVAEDASLAAFAAALRRALSVAPVDLADIRKSAANAVARFHPTVVAAALADHIGSVTGR